MVNAVAEITIPKNDYWKHGISDDDKSFMEISGGASLFKVEDNQKVELPIRRFVFEVQKFRKRTNVQKRYVQYMIISVTDEKAGNEIVGTVTTDLNSLNNDAKKFNEIGVIFSGPQYVEFCKVIRDNYYEFDLQDEVSDKKEIDVTGILNMFKAYFVGLKEQYTSIAEEKYNAQLEQLIAEGKKQDPPLGEEDFKKFGEDLKKRLTEQKEKYINDNDSASTLKVNNTELYVIPLSDFNSMIADSDYKEYDSVEIRKQLSTDGYIHCNVGSNSYVISKGSKKIRVVAFIKSELDAVKQGV